MYKLSVVDDELIVLERLKKMIERINVENILLESTFDNGDDAYNQLSVNPPDILITDIHIPFINGLELARMLKKVNPLLKIIVITGYEELSYAKEAIDLEVVGFISKPINIDELESVLEKAKDKIELEKDIESNIDEFNIFYYDSIPVLKENYLAKLLNKNQLSNKMKEQLERIDVRIDYKYIMIGYFDFDHRYTDEEKEYFESFLFTQLNLLGIDFNLFHKEYNLTVLFKSNTNFNKEAIIDNLKIIIIRAKRQLNIEISIGLSNLSSDNINYKLLYSEAFNALTLRKIFGGMQVFLYSDIEKNSRIGNLIDESIYSKLTYYIKYEQQTEKIIDVLNKIKELITHQANLNVYEFNLTNTLNSILKGLSEEIELNKEEINYSLLYQKLFTFKTVDDVFSWFLELIEKIRCINLNYIQSKSDQNMSLIINYINNNYNDSNLNLETLADEIGFSVSYITTLFKTNYKTTFVKYLTMIRMEKAKDLLIKTNIKIIEIASKVGYSDPYYFSHSFKKYFGNSPKEYRDEQS
ncbi:response regulator transcription factor [Haploplasma axanthum]|uniref:Nitrogen regulation protein NR(I) n=1 Tax=Haploplasma axanthum TaxID=29552 RepID=A0A449BBQ3_HAPAX|nr:response regulator [Haploplasma axanthum]VEU79859.1 Nitrogen regulation protein NR(I) [Haploplasma axanthum]